MAAEALAGSTGALLSGLGRLLDGNWGVFLFFWSRDGVGLVCLMKHGRLVGVGVAGHGKCVCILEVY